MPGNLTMCTTYTHTNSCTLACTHTCTHMSAHMHMHACTHAHTHTHMHTHMHAHAHTHTHSLSLSLSKSETMQMKECVPAVRQRKACSLVSSLMGGTPRAMCCQCILLSLGSSAHWTCPKPASSFAKNRSLNPRPVNAERASKQ